MSLPFLSTRRMRIGAGLFASMALLVTASPASATLLYDTDYAGLGLGKWNGIHQPASGGRISLVSNVNGLAGPVLKAEVRPGDKTYTGSYVAERAEVMGRTPPGGMGSANAWPDPVGSVRWYRITLSLPTNFQTSTDSKWVEMTQWKGRDGSVPPIGLMAQQGRFVLKVKGSEQLAVADLGPVNLGSWVTLVVGIKFSPGADGWVEAIRDGKTYIPRTSAPTMEYLKGQVDPVYLKQGVYRGSGWKTTHVAYFADTLIGTTRADVDSSAPIGTPSQPSTGNGGGSGASAPGTSGGGGAASGGTVSGGTTTGSPAVSAASVATATPAKAPSVPAVPTVTRASSTEVPLTSAPALGEAPVRNTATATIRRRKSGRLRIRIDGLSRVGTPSGRCPGSVHLRIAWRHHRTYHATVPVVGVTACRVRSFVAKPRVRHGRTVSITVVGKGYRRLSASFKV